MKVAIYGQAYNIKAEKEIQELVGILNENDVEIYFEYDFYQLLLDEINFKSIYKTFKSHKDLSSDFSVMFSIGGDGTFLRAVTYVRNLEIPIIGINTGRLGFLATIQKDEIKKALNLFLNNDYLIEERSLLQVETFPKYNDQLEDLDIALNEITITRKNTTSMIGVKTHINSEYLTNYWADGLMISTPTGSTGYSLSCSGPVVLPDCKSLIINPIAPHNLSARPIIINDDVYVDLEVESRADEFLLTLDSRIITLPTETRVRAKKADFTIKTIIFKEKTFLNTLRNKLLWGKDTRN